MMVVTEEDYVDRSKLVRQDRRTLILPEHVGRRGVLGRRCIERRIGEQPHASKFQNGCGTAHIRQSRHYLAYLPL